MKTLYIGNDNLVKITRLRNAATDAWVNDATAALTLLDADGNAVTGPTWPMAMSYVTGTNGEYRATLPADLPLVDGDSYVLAMTAISGELDAAFRVPAVARYRDH